MTKDCTTLTSYTLTDQSTMVRCHASKSKKIARIGHAEHFRISLDRPYDDKKVYKNYILSPHYIPGLDIKKYPFHTYHKLFTVHCS